MQYEVVGGAFPVVVCTLDAGESMKTERGSMVWMDDVMEMQTSGGGLGGVFSKLASGEALMQNVYTAHAPGRIAFGSSFPGKILPLELAAGQSVVVQKSAFLASEMGVQLDIHVNERVSAGFFGGEGFIMQRLSGEGIAFIECDGSFVKYELAQGQSMLVDTGNLLGFIGAVSVAVERVRGVKNVMLGGEGLFNTRVTGPGAVWLQTMPLAGLAASIAPYVRTQNS